MAIIRVLAVVVGDTNTTFYKEDGSTFDLASSDVRLPAIIDKVTPVIAAGQVASVDFESVETTHYKEFEEKTNGFVKLFRVAKEFVKHIFHDPYDPANRVKPQTIGTVPIVTNEQPAVTPSPLPAGVTQSTGIVAGGGDNITKPFELDRPAMDVRPVTQKTEKLSTAASEILKNAQSVNDEKFTDDETTSNDTIIAVVEDDKGNQVIIPGMENLKDHMALALKLGSTTGVENFLRRISKVIDKRGHSIDDLLRFMQRNDMPIADDGCLVAFKTLNRRGNKQDEYQDIHSGNVVQRVGSHVFMKEGMVDPNRRNACSNGLHVARRAYVGGFRGSSGVMVLIKVAPEDAIAVPQYDGNKMRVCGYHIVADVPSEDHSTVFSNTPLGKDTKTAKLLGAVLKGNHIGIIEEVEIGGAYGGNLRVTKIGSEADNNRQLREAKAEGAKAEPVASIDDKKHGANAAQVDTQAVAAKVAEAKASAAPSKSAQARVLFDNGSYTELKEFKKKAKKSWSSLGFNATEEALITGSSESAPEGNAKQATTDKPKIDLSTVPSKMEQDFAPKATEPKKEKKMTGTRAEVARKLFEEAVAGDKSRWTSLWLHKKESKKSWTVLGFTPKEVERIETNKPDHV